MGYEKLEPDVVKIASPVLRGLEVGNDLRLPAYCCVGVLQYGLCIGILSKPFIQIRFRLYQSHFSLFFEVDTVEFLLTHVPLIRSYVTYMQVFKWKGLSKFPIKNPPDQIQ